MSRRAVDADTVRSMFSYDHRTGVLRRREKNYRFAAGSVAGSRSNRREQRGEKNYIYVTVRGRNYAAHRLIFLYMTGRWPDIVDHINGDGYDNRWANLREATAKGNSANRAVSARSGLKGAYRERGRKRWFAAICVNGKHRRLGTFDTAEEAHEVYWRAAVEAFGQFARAK